MDTKELYVIFLEKNKATTNIHVYMTKQEADTVRQGIEDRTNSGLIKGGVCYPVAAKQTVGDAFGSINKFAPM